MRIGIIGSAEVGQALAHGFLEEGHSVMLGTRNKSKEEVVKWHKDHPKARIGDFKETAQFGELIVLCVPGHAVEEAIRQAGLDHFSNKVVIDVTNPSAPEPPVNGVLKFITTINESLMERTQRTLPDARLVKAFNSVGSAFMYKPQFPGGPPSMFICGNDEKAKQTVTDILISFGWEVEDMGKVESARAIEPLCMLWCIPGFLQNHWTHAFKLLKL
jgi:8-hydroxy-5-deazaflavin:NADPH oxidoreductase